MPNYYCEIWNYIFEPLTEPRKQKFSQVIKKINWWIICDLWCWYSWIYWALWYFERVDEINFYEYYENYIEQINNFLDILSPDYLEENFSELILFLQENNLIQKHKSYHDIAEELLWKIWDIKKVDFLTDFSDKKFDTILANESIECVNDSHEFITVIQNIYKALKLNWKHYFVMLSYGEKNQVTEELIKLKLEWNFDFNSELLEKIYKNNWFKSIKILENIFPELWNRGHYLYWECIKK